jgi:DNA-binding response OmpR family regulator
VSTVLLLQADRKLGATWAKGLEASGHQVVAVTETTDGVDQIRGGGIDIIIVDSLEWGPGLDAMVEAMEQLPDSPPLVLVSSSPRAPEVSARIGAAAFLAKPCSADELHEAVHRFAGIPDSAMVDDEPTRPIEQGRTKPKA